MQATYIKCADLAMNVFGYALQKKTPNPPKNKFEDHAIDLTVGDNRTAIRGEICRLVRDCHFTSATDGESMVRALKERISNAETSLEDAAAVSAMAIGAINVVARSYYQNFPKYRPLYEMLDNLAKFCCPGVAQMIGPDLPEEIVDTWPYFARMFSDAKESSLFMWPDV